MERNSLTDIIKGTRLNAISWEAESDDVLTAEFLIPTGGMCGIGCEGIWLKLTKKVNGASDLYYELTVSDNLKVLETYSSQQSKALAKFGRYMFLDD